MTVGAGKCRICGGSKSIFATSVCVHCTANKVQIGDQWISRDGNRVISVISRSNLGHLVYFAVVTRSNRNTTGRRAGSRLIRFDTLLSKYSPLDRTNG